MPPALRKAALTAHVTSSVGWLGSVVTVLALAVVGLTSRDGQTVRAAYVAMDVLGGTVLVPFAVASLVTGVVQSLGTPWGLFRHYWVVVKLVLTLAATIVLLLYTSTLGVLAEVATRPGSSHAGMLRSPSPVLHSAAALAVLLTAAALSVYKPRGLTPYGWRKTEGSRVTGQPPAGRAHSTPRTRPQLSEQPGSPAR